MAHDPDSPALNTELPLPPTHYAMEQVLLDQAQTIAQLRAQNELLRAVIDALPYAIYWKDADLIYRGCNQRFADDLGLAIPDAIIGKTDADLPWQAEEIAAFQAVDQRILVTKTSEYDDQETVIHPDHTQEWFETYKLPLCDPTGAAIGVLGTYNNITARKQAEATVLAQAALLQELSTPVIPLTDQVLVLPLIGTIDSRRAQQILTAILDYLTNSHTFVVFLDITGVPIVDTQVALALIQTGRAVQLLGARLVLTGIRPEVAQALVGLGVELGSMITYSTLQRGLAEVANIRPETIGQRRR
jgi:rsbT co-antagonist protein RsbR